MYDCMYVFMYICICDCVCVCMYVCMHDCMYVCIYEFMYVWLYVCTNICMRDCMYLWMYVCTILFIYVRMYVRLSACMYKGSHYNTHTHTHTHIRYIGYSSARDNRTAANILSNKTSPVPTSHILSHTRACARARTHARTATGWFPQLTMTVGEMLWLPGCTRISWIVTSPCINVTHACIFAHIT
jgi:hypothetical protein